MRIIAILLMLVSAFSFAEGKKEAPKAQTSPERPVWFWGTPQWAGDYDQESLEVGNKWLLNKFGFTVKITSGVPQGTTWIQALNMQLASSSMPDVLVGGRLDANAPLDMVTAFVNFANNKKLLDLTPYFNSKDYPNLSGANKENLRPYMVGGKIYAVPSWGWRVKADDPFWGNPMMVARLDLGEKYGYPKTTTELYDFLVKSKNETDLNGKPVLGLGLQPVADFPGNLKMLLEYANGGGWDITQNKLLMPNYMSVEYFSNLKGLNKLYREGLMDPNIFTNDSPKYTANVREARYSTVIGGTGVGANYREGTLKDQFKKLGKDSPKIPELIAKQYVYIAPPVADKPGLIHSDIAGMSMISSSVPVPDKFMKFVDWLISKEGIVTYAAEPGILGVDWEWKDAPVYWQNIGKEPGNQDMGKGGTYRDAKASKTTPPLVPPVLHYLAHPSYSSYYEWVHYNPDHKQSIMAQFGVKIGGYDSKGNALPSALEWTKQTCDMYGALAKAIPSYKQAVTQAPTDEITAISTAQQRVNEYTPKIITAATEAEFDTQYNAFVKSVVGIANWKTVYEGKQKRYEEWLTSNKFDDRKDLGFVTPVRAWVDAMGWTRYPY